MNEERSLAAVRAKQYYQQHIDRRRHLIAKEAQAALAAHTLTGDTAIALWARFVEAGILETSMDRDARQLEFPMNGGGKMI